MEVLSTGRFFRKMFCQLNNCYVVKQQYGPLNTMCFCSLQPHFYSCQQLNIALPWLRSVRMNVEYLFRLMLSHQLTSVNWCKGTLEEVKQQPSTVGSTTDSCLYSTLFIQIIALLILKGKVSGLLSSLKSSFIKMWTLPLKNNGCCSHSCCSFSSNHV